MFHYARGSGAKPPITKAPVTANGSSLKCDWGWPILDQQKPEIAAQGLIDLDRTMGPRPLWSSSGLRLYPVCEPVSRVFGIQGWGVAFCH